MKYTRRPMIIEYTIGDLNLMYFQHDDKTAFVLRNSQSTPHIYPQETFEV